MAMAFSDDDTSCSEIFLSCLYMQVIEGSLLGVKSLVEGEAGLNFLDKAGTKLLHFAVFNRSTDILEYFLEKGLPMDARDEDGASPLFSCANEGTLANMLVLITHGADIRAKDKQGTTALHHAAVHSNSAEMIACLIEKGARIDEKNTSGMTAFHFCSQQGELKAMMYLVREGTNISERTIGGISALHLAVCDRTSLATEYLLTLGMEIDASDDEGHTPLHLSAALGNLRSTKLLVDAGANLRAVDSKGDTGLHHAVNNKAASELIKYLSRQGISLESRHKNRNKPLSTRACVEAPTLKISDLLIGDSHLEKENESGQTAAANEERIGILEYLLNKGMSMDARNNLGNAAIHLCAAHGTKTAMQVLLRMGCDIEMKNADSQTPLFWAILNKNAKEMIVHLVSQGAVVNSKDKNGNSPLHHCITEGTLEIVKLLLENGADIRAKNANGMTALQIARSHRKHMMVEFLLRAEAWKSKQDVSINKVLYCMRKHSLQEVKLLCDKGLAKRCTDQGGLTALHHAVVNEERGVVELVLNQGISLEARCNIGSTPLHRCAAQGSLENLQVLVKKGANVQAKDHRGRGCIHYAASNENMTAILEFLLEQGLSIEARDNHGMTPVHSCARKGTLKNMMTLTDKGADVKSISNEGTTTLHCAALNEKTTEIISFLLSQGVMMEARTKKGFTALHHSIMMGKLGNTKLLLESGADLGARANNGITSLHMASTYGHTVEELEYLLEKGAPIAVKDNDGMTPLLTCALKGDLQKMKLLVERGADILDQDEQDGSALHYAAANKKTTDMMRYLLDKGISLEMRDKFGRTPLLFSAQNGNLTNVKFLREAGADLKSLDRHKRTAMHHAAANIRGRSIIEYLIARGLPVDARDEVGLSPLLVSKGCGIAENERTLLENGAKKGEHDPDLNEPSVVALLLAMMNQKIK